MEIRPKNSDIMYKGDMGEFTYRLLHWVCYVTGSVVKLGELFIQGELLQWVRCYTGVWVSCKLGDVILGLR